MVDQQLRSKVEQLATDPGATANERLLASALLDALRGVRQVHANSQWAADQLDKLSKHTGVKLDLPP